MSSGPYRIFISAGEESGDLQGAGLVASLMEMRPDFQISGLGGKKMRQAGARTLFDIDHRMGGIGFFESLGSLRHHWQIYRALSKEILSGKYQAAILVHYPLFNLLLAKICRKANLPTFFFISPQVWAWRKGRVKKIRRRINKMFVILPFEEQIYRDAGVDVEFVGHPFVELVRPALTSEEACREFGLAPGTKTVGLLPGSRISEIDRLLDTMVRAAALIRKGLRDCQFILPIADSIDPGYIREKLKNSPVAVRCVAGKTYDAMNCCDYLVVASGSATLEAGLLGRPMVIVYKLRPLTFWMGRWFVRVKNFGLINIVAGEEVVPELLQGEATAERIAQEALSVLGDPARGQAIRSRLLRVRESLGEPGVARRIAKSILAYLKISPTHEKVSI